MGRIHPKEPVEKRLPGKRVLRLETRDLIPDTCERAGKTKTRKQRTADAADEREVCESMQNNYCLIALHWLSIALPPKQRNNGLRGGPDWVWFLIIEA